MRLSCLLSHHQRQRPHALQCFSLCKRLPSEPPQNSGLKAASAHGHLMQAKGRVPPPTPMSAPHRAPRTGPSTMEILKTLYRCPQKRQGILNKTSFSKKWNCPTFESLLHLSYKKHSLNYSVRNYKPFQQDRAPWDDFIRVSLGCLRGSGMQNCKNETKY